MKTIQAAALATLALVSASALAAKPTSVQFAGNHETDDGTPYSTYVVNCSDNSEKTMTAWDNRKKWCVGDTTSEVCEKKQIKAAKKACK